MLRILLVGDDFRLLATRAAVLSRTNASTVCCNQREMKQALIGEVFDVVVVCHSLPEQAAADVKAVARLWWPEAKLLLVRSDQGWPAYHEQGFDAVVPADPKGLLHDMTTLLRKLPDPQLEHLAPQGKSA